MKNLLLTIMLLVFTLTNAQKNFGHNISNKVNNGSSEYSKIDYQCICLICGENVSCDYDELKSTSCIGRDFEMFKYKGKKPKKPLGSHVITHINGININPNPIITF